MATVKIGLDVGHGLHTAGKQTPDGIKEWTLNDKVADKVTAILKDYNCTIYRTDNNEGEVDEPLSQRLNGYLKAGVKCLVSIHHNACSGKWNKATGVEVYTDRNPLADDKKLAKLIYDRLVKYTGLKGRGIKEANFWVINQNKIPAVLVEGGFMDGTEDYKVITSDEGQTAYAKAVAEAIIEFCKLTKKKATAKPKAKATEKITATYQIHNKDGWKPNVSSGCAGVLGKAIDGVYALLSSGNIWYKVHTKKTKKWLPEVKNREDYAGNFGQAIDGIMFKADKGKIKYQVHQKKPARWLPAVSGYDVNDTSNGYAGNFGKEIDGIKIWVE